MRLTNWNSFHHLDPSRLLASCSLNWGYLSSECCYDGVDDDQMRMTWKLWWTWMQQERREEPLASHDDDEGDASTSADFVAEEDSHDRMPDENDSGRIADPPVDAV